MNEVNKGECVVGAYPILNTTLALSQKLRKLRGKTQGIGNGNTGM